MAVLLPFWPLPNVPKSGYLEFPGQAGPFLPLGPQGAGLGQLQGQVVRREWGVGRGSQLQAGVVGWRWEMKRMGGRSREEVQIGGRMEKQEMVMNVASENRRGGTAAGLCPGVCSPQSIRPPFLHQRNWVAPTHTPPRDGGWSHPECCPQCRAGFTLRPGPSARMMPTLFPGIFITTSHPLPQLTELRYGEGAPEA